MDVVAVEACWGSYHRVVLKREVYIVRVCVLVSPCWTLESSSVQVNFPPNARSCRWIQLKMKHLKLFLLKEIRMVPWLTKPYLTYILTGHRVSHIAGALKLTM